MAGFTSPTIRSNRLVTVLPMRMQIEPTQYRLNSAVVDNRLNEKIDLIRGLNLGGNAIIGRSPIFMLNLYGQLKSLEYAVCISPDAYHRDLFEILAKTLSKHKHSQRAKNAFFGELNRSPHLWRSDDNLINMAVSQEQERISVTYSFSFFATKESFLRVRKLFRENRVIHIPSLWVLPNHFGKIRLYLESKGIKPAIVHLSNIQRYLPFWRLGEFRKCLNNIGKMSDRVVLLDAEAVTYLPPLPTCSWKMCLGRKANIASDTQHARGGPLRIAIQGEGKPLSKSLGSDYSWKRINCCDGTLGDGRAFLISFIGIFALMSLFIMAIQRKFGETE